ncbi:hypothetical protein PIB30_016831 [Stylosanthes scabra]|uniref:glutathione transferase n=1 Tax=Stylosanthes scabra TaxID=79078 RepID=A0ABU6S6Y7_9FABA|nr:hypothetical protein [Stylosanthes scabra]
MDDLKLHGFWVSPFTMRVVWTLKLKGIAYENIEENPTNKSPELLEYNPVYKKAPVLVHAGKPICESMIIVEYIDEIWPHNSLVPHDPYERAQARFWVTYADQMVPALFAALYFNSGAGEIEKIWEHLKVFEDQCLGDKRKFFGGDTINIVDIALGSIFRVLFTIEDVNEVKVMEAEKFPLLQSWFNNFKNVPVIKENFPDREKTSAAIKSIIAKVSGSS